MNNMIGWIKHNKFVILSLIFVLCVSGLSHGYNMFHYPYYENDEGTYIAQAWSVLTQGKLAPYTYWYDHAPFGWFLIALWSVLTGGFFTFGLSVNSGRVLMLVLQLASTLLIFLSVRKMTKSTLSASLAGLIFSLSPLGIYFHRRVLLDNIMVFWVLLSLYLLLTTNKKLKHYLFSSLAFAVGVLTKESAIFFFPIFIYIAYSQAHKSHRSIATVKWIVIVLAISSMYVLYALLKGELFPSGSLLGGKNPHVSLMETWLFQATRSGNGNVFNPDSGFRLYFEHWWADDAPLILLGAITTIVGILFSIKQKVIRYITLLTMAYWYYLMRGGIVIEFYVVPLIALLSMQISMIVHEFTCILYRNKFSKLLVPIIYIAIIFSMVYYNRNKTDIYFKDQTIHQVQAVEKIKKEIPKDAVIIIDNYAYVDLHSQIPYSVYIQKDAQYYWKADKDPEIKNIVLDNDWRNIDYILFSDQMKYDIYHVDLELVRKAYEHSTLIKSYPGTGYDIEIRKVDPIMGNLEDSWKFYIGSYDKGGQIIDPYSNQTTSESQSYAMLRAVIMDDRKEFDKVWNWTKYHLQNSDNNLFLWSYGNSTTSANLKADTGTATDADEDIALSLYLAGKKWNENYYINESKQIVKNIWESEVTLIDKLPYILAGNWATDKKNINYVFNTSYFSPYAYRIFSQIDPDHDWKSVVDSSYEMLEKCSLPLKGENQEFLPPDWCLLNKKGIILPVSIDNLPRKYSYDAMRTLWRITLDYKWNKDQRAFDYLSKMTIWSNNWENTKSIGSTFVFSSPNMSTDESLAHYGILMTYFSVMNKNLSMEIYNTKIAPLWNTAGYWGDPSNYFDQNWVWLGVMLSDDTYLHQLIPN